MERSPARRLCRLALLFALLLVSVGAPAGAQSLSPAQFAQGVFDATNAARQQNNLPPLKPDVRLAKTALAHSQAMANAGLQAHQVPGELDPGTRLMSAGYNWMTWRENLGEFPLDGTPDDLVASWMGDPVHRVNILAGDVTDMGVGVVIGSFPGHPEVQTFWITEDMGEEMPQAKDPAITVTPNFWDFGAVTVGKNATKFFFVGNSGKGTLNVTSVTSSDPQFVVTPTTPFSIAPGGASKALKMVFTPKTQGVQTATLTIASNDPKDPQDVTHVQGDGASPVPKLKVTPLQVEIDTSKKGSPKTGTFLVDNVGDPGSVLAGAVFPVDNPQMKTSAGFKVGPPFQIFLPQGKPAIKVTVTLTTTKKGVFTGQAGVNTNGGNETVDLKGITVALKGQPQIQVTPTDLSFYAAVGKTDSRTFTVKNVGDPGTTLTGSASVPQGVFSIAGNANFSLGQGQTQNITVQFAPTDKTKIKYEGTVATVKSNAANEDPVEVTLSGSLPIPVISVRVVPAQQFDSYIVFGHYKGGNVRKCTVTNIGQPGSVLIGDAKLSPANAPYTLDKTHFELGAQESMTITITWNSPDGQQNQQNADVNFPSNSGAIFSTPNIHLISDYNKP